MMRSLRNPRSRRIWLPMLVVVLAHRAGCFLGFRRVLKRPGQICPDLAAQRIGNAEFLVVPAGIHGGQDSKKNLTRINGDFWLVFRYGQLCQGRNKEHAKHSSKTEFQ